MRLELRLEAASGYRSPSQRARVLTEAWVGENMYCPACESDRVKKALEGGEGRRLRLPGVRGAIPAQRQEGGGFVDRVVDSAYGPMAIERGASAKLPIQQLRARYVS